MKSLIALFLPGIALCVSISLLWNHPQFTWLHDWRAYPWEFWVASFCAIVATIGGVVDWIYHRKGLRVVSAKERKYELFALAGGVPLFILMAAASLIEKPTIFLIPVILVVLYMTVLICYDEFIYHRRCKPFETAMHRLLVFGNGFAWLAWAHWCFVRGGAYV